jgi:uncharacterized protein
MGHYDTIARSPSQPSGRCTPIIMEDGRANDIAWELWIAGFERALMVRPQALLSTYPQASPKVASAYFGLIELADTNNGQRPVPQTQIETLTASAHDLIGGYVEALNDCD